MDIYKMLEKDHEVLKAGDCAPDSMGQSPEMKSNKFV